MIIKHIFKFKNVPMKFISKILKSTQIKLKYKKKCDLFT